MQGRPDIGGDGTRVIKAYRAWCYRRSDASLCRDPQGVPLRPLCGRAGLAFEDVRTRRAAALCELMAIKDESNVRGYLLDRRSCASVRGG